MPSTHDLTVHLGHDELVIRRRYESLSIANDVLIALWFVVGSAWSLWGSGQVADWLFLLGSVEFLARPAIRLARRVHLRRAGHAPTSDASSDF
jgi:hypothetical protein